MSKNNKVITRQLLVLAFKSTNASYGTEFATETNVQAVKQANAQSEAKKAHKVQMLCYGTEFATETDVHAVKKQNAQSAAKQSQSSSSNQ